MSTPMTDIEDAVRAWARGIYPSEAGAELLIRQRRAIYQGAPWITELEVGDETGPGMASIDVDVLLYEAGVWSGGEQRVVRIAASLLGGPAVDLSEEIPGLDRENLALVLAALAHANGSHEHSGVETDPDGRPLRFVRLTSLYPWPEVERTTR